MVGRDCFSCNKRTRTRPHVMGASLSHGLQSARNSNDASAFYAASLSWEHNTS